jgi:hypothetical protein
LILSEFLTILLLFILSPSLWLLILFAYVNLTKSSLKGK